LIPNTKIMRISNLTKITLITGVIGYIFLGILLFAELPYNYGIAAFYVAAVFLIALLFLIAYGEEQKKKVKSG
jgi:hypothetical protein